MVIDSDGGGGGGGGGAKQQRVDEGGDRCEAVGADAIPTDRISALPADLRRLILTHLPLKYAIRTGAFAHGWRNLWRDRWEHPSSVELHLRSGDDLRRELDKLTREPRPCRRLDRFSLVVETSSLKASELRRFTEYTADCRVEDLHVEVRITSLARKLTFHLPLSSPLLARLSLRGMKVPNMYYKGAQPFRALQVIQIHSVFISNFAFGKMMALSPNLLTLDMRNCKEGNSFQSLDMPQKLKSVTVVDCDKISIQIVPSLRSFRYRGDFVKAPFSLPRDAVLADLYIRFAHSVSEQDIAKRLNNSLPKDLSGLNVLTICCNALPVVSSLKNDGASAQMPNLNLPRLRELQLLMLKWEAVNLADLYVFLRTCQCPNLERLFVQLPALSYNPMEGSTVEVKEEPPKDVLDSLLMVKVLNFNWRRAEVQLVIFLLRKASSLRKLLMVSPNVTLPGLPGLQEEDLLLLKEALANGKIILSDSDNAATQPYHSELEL